MKVRILVYSLLILFSSIQFMGCITAAATAYEAIALGSLAKGVLESREKANIDAAVSPGVTKEQLNQIKRVAFVLEDTGQKDHFMLTGGLTEIMSDGLTIEMLKYGYECVETLKLRKTLQDQGNKLTGPLDLNQALKAASLLNIQAIITGNVHASASMGSSGLLSTTVTATSKVQSVTLKFINVKTGDILMAVAINYKHGKKPDAAAKSMARIIRAKLEDPFGNNNKKKKKEK
jgi:hypothetical protein